MADRHAPLVSCETVFENHDRADWVVFDCRHDLSRPDAGPLAYSRGHVPGSFHAHIDRDLSAPKGDGRRGRHPLPMAGALQHFLRLHGVDGTSQVVAYDEGPGMWAGRLWWLLRYFGHEHVAVMDGGLARWKELGLPLTEGHERPRRDGGFAATPGKMPTTDAAAIEATLEQADAPMLIDVRARERYRGEVEPIDPVAGHIPGAHNIPYAEHIGPDGLWLSPDELRGLYESHGAADRDVTVYCGSGVTAAHAVLAMELAGLPTPRLYPGSWSEWSRPAAKRPVERADPGEEEE